MQTAVAKRLADGRRLHLQHGPIDLIIGADGDRERAFAAATQRFQTVLEELVAELPILRCQKKGEVTGAIAWQMQRAIHPHATQGFVTPMAAVAGAVADTVLAAMLDKARPRRAYVNNGGDIALWLTGAERFRTLVAGSDNAELARITLTTADPARGIATSGRHGRSLSRGIADAVTVLAQTAAEADVAATMIANAVDLPGHLAILRVPACDLDPDSDLGQRQVVTDVGGLAGSDVTKALGRGGLLAEQMLGKGLICGAALFLQGQSYIIDPVNTQFNQLGKTMQYA